MKLSFNRSQELIKRRFSCRSYQPEALSKAHQMELKFFLSELNKINLPILHLYNPELKFKLLCGINTRRIDSLRLLKNSTNLIFASINQKLPFCYELYGYLMELVVLKATELNINTCWLGYFEGSLFQSYLMENKIIPSIVVLGYPLFKSTFKEKIIRLVINANERRPWEKLFFKNNLNQPIVKNSKYPYFTPLEYLRLAPSSGNTQPWRIIVDTDQNSFHFYKVIIRTAYEKRKLHNIDLGIAMSHFDIGMSEIKLMGKWEKFSNPPLVPLTHMEYIISWTIIS